MVMVSALPPDFLGWKNTSVDAFERALESLCMGGTPA